jgi:hypothetical protein
MSYQVGMMAEIYTNAKEVYIGIETDHHSDHRDLASTVFRGLMENRHLNEFTLNRCSWASLHDQFKSFYHLFDSKWFTRAWTVQEVCLASKTTFLTVEGCFTWKEVASAFSNWNEHRKGCCSSVAASLDHDSSLREWLYDTYSHIQSINATVTALSAGQHIIKSLLYYQPMRASNPVDKYFAFRGLHTHQSSIPLPLPDYSHTKNRTFTELAQWLLEDQHSLFVLNVDLPDRRQPFNALYRLMRLAGLLVRVDLPGNEPRCPSWVPDWSTDSSINAIYRRIRLAFLDSYSAAKGLTMEFSFPAPGSLRLRGIRFDRVECVAEDRFDLDSTQNNRKVLDAWYQFASPTHYDKACYFDLRDDNFHLAMLGGCIVERGKPVRAARTADIAELKHLMSSTDIDSSAYHTPVMRSHIAAVLERRFFCLEGGRFGLGPDSIRPGDEIWILAGGPAPFVLRKLPSQSTDSQYVGSLQFHSLADEIC